MSEIKPRKPRKAKAAPAPEASGDLLAALAWIKCAQKPSGTAPYETHCVISDGWLTAFEGTIAAGHRVELDMSATIRTDRLAAALSRAGNGLSLTYEPGENGAPILTVAGARLRVIVPTLPPGTVEAAEPDTEETGCLGGAPATDALLVGMEKLLPLTREGAATVLESSLLLENGSLTATNLIVIMQYWHGLALPTFVLPRSVCAYLAKQTGLTHLAWSANTVTFGFGPDKWIKTHVYGEQWPNLSPILDVETDAAPVPPGLVDAVEDVAPQRESGDVILDSTGVRTTDGSAVAAGAYPQFTNPRLIGPEWFLFVAKHSTSMDFSYADRIFFFGDNIRGALASCPVT